MENSIVQLGIRWTLHLGSVGGEGLFILSISSFSDVICVLVEYVLENISFIRLTLAAASVLSTFDLVRKVDENGREIEPKEEFTITGIR